VQEHGFERTDIFIETQDAQNSASVRPAGADLDSGHYGAVGKAPELNGAVEVSVECEDERTRNVEDALRAAGAEQVRLQ
jgi:hypothetical protein